jgi:hypothetical protein
MKKRMILLIVIVCSVILGSGVIHSQTALTIGGHYWRAAPDLQTTVEGVEINPGNMYGPYLNLRIGKLTLGSSLFFGTFKFEFENTDFSFDLSRKDMNFSLGYSILPRITIFGAVKILSYTGEKELSFIDEWGWEFIASYEQENKGTLYGGGISCVIPFTGSPVFLFGSAAYLIGTMEWMESYKEDGWEVIGYDGEYDTSIMAITGGIGFQTRSGLTFMVGYRADLSNVEEEDAGEEKIHGIMATAAYTIR